jgi:hypothetical protein
VVLHRLGVDSGEGPSNKQVDLAQMSAFCLARDLRHVPVQGRYMSHSDMAEVSPTWPRSFGVNPYSDTTNDLNSN